MKKILLAGATGYLGGYILKELTRRGFYTRVIARNPDRVAAPNSDLVEIVTAEITQVDSVKGCCDGVDAVISTVGITRQKDGLTYMDVDYQGNINLLEEAKESGVKKFIYVSVLNGDKLRYLKICDAKEKFVDELESSGMHFCVVRPNGFFADMAEIYNMAKRGRVYLFGDGEFQANPIHGEDLAQICVDAIDHSDQEIEIGGPEILSQNEVAGQAFQVLGKKPVVTHIPKWITRFVLGLIKAFSNSKTYGPIEFFLTVMSVNMIAPEYGKHSLKEFFELMRDQELDHENDTQ